ncbi:hypothetical protein Dimus_029689 [Dionaea muscipula]
MACAGASSESSSCPIVIETELIAMTIAKIISSTNELINFLAIFNKKKERKMNKFCCGVLVAAAASLSVALASESSMSLDSAPAPAPSSGSPSTVPAIMGSMLGASLVSLAAYYLH